MHSVARRTRERAHRGDGFTLIELLVVIVIIGILAAIALPMYLHQREKAKDTAVVKGVHDIRIGIESWAVDHDGAFPSEDQVAATGAVGATLDAWPQDPYHGGDMADEGDQPGDFDYEVSADGKSYTLVGFLNQTD